jgi:hypothetical protein
VLLGDLESLWHENIAINAYKHKGLKGLNNIVRKEIIVEGFKNNELRFLI